MKHVKHILLALLLVLTLLLTAACGATTSADNHGAAPSSPGVAGSEEFSSDAKAPEIENFDWNVDAPSSGASAPSHPQLPSGVKMIYRGNLELESTQFDQTAAGLEQLAADLGGYFESSQLYNYGNRRSAQYTIRIPSDRYQDFCTQVDALAQINSQRHTSEDVSQQYYDTQSRLETQRTKLVRLQELLAKAENIADLITIESAIADTEWNIDSLTTTLRDYDALVDFSTIEIALEEVVSLSPQEALQESFGERLSRAFRQGTKRFGQAVQDLVLSLAYGWVGWLIVLLVIAGVLCAVFRRKAKKPSTPADCSHPPAEPPEHSSGCDTPKS